MNDLFVNRGTKYARVVVVSLERGLHAQIFDLLLGGALQIHGRRTRPNQAADMIEHFAHNRAASPHLFNFRR